MKQSIILFSIALCSVAIGIAPSRAQGQNQSAATSAPEPHKMNNMVTRLLSVQNPKTEQAYHFTLPHDGFVWIGLDAEVYGSKGSVALYLDGQNEANRIFTSDNSRLYPQFAKEAMHHLTAGEHTVIVKGKMPYQIKALTVNSIPDLYYWSHDQHWTYDRDTTHIFDWEWLKRNGLLNYTHVVVLHQSFAEPHRSRLIPDLKEWKDLGRKVLLRGSIPRIRYKDKPSAEVVINDTYQYHKELFADPLVDGVIADELIPGREPYESHHKYWIEAYRKILNEYPNKVMHGAIVRVYSPTIDPFLQFTLEQKNMKLDTQHYYPTAASEEAYRAEMQRWGVDRGLARWEAAVPGIRKKTAIINSLTASSIFSFHRHPDVDYKAHVDIQLQELANNPAYEGLTGISSWKLHYTNEELVRFISDAYRHYFIEGNTERFYNRPYRPNHILNGGFEDGAIGWKVKEATPGSSNLLIVGETIPFKKNNTLNRVPEGRHMLAMTVNKNAPNVLTQKIVNLTPGKKYVLEFYTINLDSHRPYSTADAALAKAAQENEKNHPIHPVQIAIQGARTLRTDRAINTLPQRILAAEARSAASGNDQDPEHFMPQSFSGGPNNKTSWNHYYIVFEAESNEATLTITDQPKDPSGSNYIGQTLLYDFVTVFPYYESALR